MRTPAYLLLLIALPLTAAAQSNNRMQREPLREELLTQRKQLESTSHQERIQILQTADNCIRNANSHQAFRACEDAERSARQSFLEKDRARKEQLKSQFMNGRPREGNA